MAEILSNIHLLEARVNRLRIKPRDSMQYVYDHLEEQLFVELAVDKDQYEVSLDYYLKYPGELEKVYTSVLDSLQKMRNVADVNTYRED